MHRLQEACADAGVSLAAHDRSTLNWPANDEATTVAVFIGLIGRAYEGGRGASARERT